MPIPSLRKSVNFFPPRDGGNRTAPVRTAAALEAIRERKGWGDSEEDVLQQPHSFDPFIPYQVRGGPSVSVGHKKGRADREEAGERNKRRESSLVGGEEEGEKEP